MNPNDLGSARVGFEVDLQQLSKDLGRASKMIGQLQAETDKQTQRQGRKGGILGALFGQGNQAGLGLSLLGNFQGSLGRLGTTIGGTSRLFSGMGTAAAGAGVSLGAMAAVAGVVSVAILGVVAAVKGLQLAWSQLKQAIAGAIDLEATNTRFEVLSRNLGLASGQIQLFRNELQKMDFAGSEQTQIMESLIRSLGSNGLSAEALQATAAMRELSVAAGQSTTQGVLSLSQALTTLNPQLLEEHGLTQTATQVFNEYGATLGKTHDEMSRTEKQMAILNAVIAQSKQSTGLASAATDDLGRSLTKLRTNFSNVQAGIGQVFTPVLSGIVKALNDEVFGLSKSISDSETQIKSLGDAIASRVVPMFQSLIGWIKSLPWVGIVDGIYRVVQGFQLMSRASVYVWKTIINGVKFGIGAFRAIAGAIGMVIGVFNTAVSVIQNFWRVLAGEQTLGQAVDNIKASVENEILASFDTLIEGVEGMAGAVGDQFNDFVGLIKGVGGDIKQIIDGFNVKDWWAGLPKGLQEAADDALNKFKETAGGMSKEAAKAIKDMHDKLAKENADFARKQAEALRDYTEQLADLVAAHRDRIKDLQRDIKKESDSFEKAQSERTKAYQEELNRLNKADSDRKKDVEMQIAEELAKGRFADQAKLASLRARLEYEDAAHKAAVEEASKRYNEDTENAVNAHQERLNELQTALDQELAIQAKHAADFARFRDHQIADDITKLKEQYARRKAEDERAHQERLAEIIRQGTEQAGQANAAGQQVGAAQMAGYAGGIAGGAGAVNAASKKTGKDSQKSTQAGMEEERKPTSDKFKSILTTAATIGGAAIGSIFGPVGTLIGGVIGNAIGRMAPSIGNALKNMFEKAKGFIGDLTRWGKDVVANLGKGIANAWGSAKQGFIDGWRAIGLPGFAAGGIVSGPAGHDKVLANVSAGEMILNRGQQQRLFNMLNGSISPDTGGSASGNIIIEQMNVTLPAVRDASGFERELQLKFATMRTT